MLPETDEQIQIRAKIGGILRHHGGKPGIHSVGHFGMC